MTAYLPIVRDANGNLVELPAGGQLGTSLSPVYKTGNFTAVANTTYEVNTTGGAVSATLPSTPSTGDTVYINDTTNSFGAYNCTVVGSSNIDGLAFSGASNVVLNCPGNNATFTWNGSAWKCTQVTNGHWGTRVASAAANVEFTGLPGGDVDFELVCENYTGTATDPWINLGYGATPTYMAGTSYFTTMSEIGSSFTRTVSSSANGVITRATGTVSGPSNFRIKYYTKSATLVNGFIDTFWNGLSSCVGITSITMSGALTAIKVVANTGSLTGSFHLKWIKNNV